MTEKLEDVLKNWCTVKKFKDKKVEKETLDKIFSLTTNAPTAFNLQPYRFTVLDSEKAKNKAVESANPVNGWIRYADKIVILIGDEKIDVNADKVLQNKIKNNEIDEEKAENLRKMYKNYKNRDENFMTGWLTRNTVIPGTFFMLACRTQQIGVCPVRGFKQEKLADKLELNQTEKPILLFPIGHPKKDCERHWRRSGEKIYEIK